VVSILDSTICALEIIVVASDDAVVELPQMAV